MFCGSRSLARVLQLFLGALGKRMSLSRKGNLDLVGLDDSEDCLLFEMLVDGVWEEGKAAEDTLLQCGCWQHKDAERWRLSALMEVPRYFLGHPGL